jgi:hypothetical protein
VKEYSQMPYFEAGTELFVRDYTKTSLRVVVRDARLREHDPILGIIDLPLKETLRYASQVTRMYSLQGGVGWGKVNISILFKGLKMSLPKELSGWETGTIEVKGPIKVEAVSGVDFDWREKKLVLSSSEASSKISARAANSAGDGALEWQIDDDIRLPVYDRYSSALYFDYGGSSVKIGPLGSKRDAFAALCASFPFAKVRGNAQSLTSLLRAGLSELIDDEPKEVRLPVIVAKSPAVRFNYINDQCKKTHDYEIVGYLTTTVVLDSGLDADHEKCVFCSPSNADLLLPFQCGLPADSLLRTRYATTQTARHEFEQYDRVVRRIDLLFLRASQTKSLSLAGGTSRPGREERSRKRRRRH